MDPIAIGTVWLCLLTIGMAWNTALLVFRGREEQRRLAELAAIREEVRLKQSLLELRDLLMDERNRRNIDVERRAHVLIERLKADPMLHDRYWTEATALENVLK